MLLIAIEGTQGFPRPLHSNSFQVPHSLMAVNGCHTQLTLIPRLRTHLKEGSPALSHQLQEALLLLSAPVREGRLHALSAVWPKWSLCNLCQAVCCACALCPTFARAVSGSCSGWSGQVGVGRLQVQGTSHLLLLVWDGGPGSCSILLK